MIVGLIIQSKNRYWNKFKIQNPTRCCLWDKLKYEETVRLEVNGDSESPGKWKDKKAEMTMTDNVGSRQNNRVEDNVKWSAL